MKKIDKTTQSQDGYGWITETKSGINEEELLHLSMMTEIKRGRKHADLSRLRTLVGHGLGGNFLAGNNRVKSMLIQNLFPDLKLSYAGAMSVLPVAKSASYHYVLANAKSYKPIIST